MSAFLLDELPLLIEAIYSSKDRDKIIHRLPVDDAQKLIDVMYKARSAFSRHRKSADRPSRFLDNRLTQFIPLDSKETS